MFFLASAICGCKNEEKKTYRIGLSQCAFDTHWRLQMNVSITANAAQRGNIELLMTDGKNSNSKQIQDIKDLLSKNIDLLMVSPNEADSLTEIISEVYKSGVPVILIDRKINGKDYTCFIGADNAVIGSKAANYLNLLGNGRKNILEIHGQRGSSASIDRGFGFNSSLDPTKNYKHIGDLYCEWSKDTAYQAVKKYWSDGGRFNVIYSHNDDMAIGARAALNDLGVPQDSVTIIGTDGAAGENGGIKAVIDHKITATFFYPDGNEEAINAAEDILAGKSVPKEIVLNTVQIDNNNAEGLFGQMTLSRKQEERIIKQSETIKDQSDTISDQSQTIFVTVFFLISAILAGGYIYKLLTQKKQQTQMLNEQNAEIIAQKEELQATNNQLNDSKEKLERSKEKIEGSIRYAQTIQCAALPLEQDLNYIFNAFVLYKPKDIVSGDFYWYHREGLNDVGAETHIFGVIDCTGHGVPGAFMSLIGINLLDQIVKQRKIKSPAMILEELNSAVRTALKQKDSENNDGMEAVICKIEKLNDSNITLTYEGAKFPLFHYIKKENRIETYKTARREIGGKFRNIESKVNFEDHSLKIDLYDRIYMSSDGIGDQNDINRKRYSAKRLVQALQDSISMNMTEQRDYLWNDLSSFKGFCEQRDDITVMGIEIV